MTERSRSQVCSRFITGIAGSNAAEVMNVRLLCCVRRGVCDELVTRSVVSYRARMLFV